MNTQSVFPIKREDYEGRKDEFAKKKAGWIKSDTGDEMNKIAFGNKSTDVENLWDIVRNLDEHDAYQYEPEEREVLNAIRDAFCIQRYTYNNILLDKVGINGNMTPQQKSATSDVQARAAYASVHSMFFATGYILSKLEGVIDKQSDRPAVKDITDLTFQFFPSDYDMRKYALGKFATSVKKSNLEKTLNDGKDLLNYTKKFFEKVHENIQQEKDKYRMLKNIDGNGLVMTDLENTVFDIDGIKFKGFTYEANKVDAPKLEFKEVKKEEVVGNRHAKKMMVRDVERLALYDFKEQKNPILEYGALVWSALLDGLPGTGKTTMMQMEMTYLKHLSEQAGLPFKYWVIDASEKNEYYGKAQRDYRNKLNETLNPAYLNLVYFDDVDLLIPGRNSGTMNAADQDILKLFMDYLAGIFSVFKGNTITRAATNAASNLDGAFRQRFQARYLIDGPTTAEDAGKLMMLKFSKMQKNGLINIPAGNMKDLDDVAQILKYEMGDQTAGIMKQLKTPSPGKMTWYDIGKICKEYQNIDPRFTGRFIDNVKTNVIAVSADFDLDKQIFADPKVFMEKSYKEKTGILGEHFKKIDPEIILQEMDRYFQSEIRYMKADEDNRIKNAANSYIAQKYGMAVAALWEKDGRVKPNIRDITP